MGFPSERHVFLAGPGAPAHVLSETTPAVRWSIEDVLADQGLFATHGMRVPDAPRSQDIRWYLGTAPAVVGARAGWTVRSRLGWAHDYGGDAAAGAPTPGLKMISFVKRKATLSIKDFDERYRRHIEVAREHHAGIWQYAQSIVAHPLSTDAPPIDGISELWFRTEDDFRQRFYSTDRSPAAVGADTAEFIDYAGTFSVLTRETLHDPMASTGDHL